MQKTIAVIDDEEEFLEVMTSWLEDQGYRAVTATNADDGLSLLYKENPSLLLLDIMMPDTDGFEVLSKIRNDQRLSKVPVVMVSARGETGSIMEAQKLKAEDYVIKPFQSEVLLRTIRKHER
ncbi:MAG: response regulator [Candidatus Omnitrophica bacterium]|nr:response regulator [Candidatus Omnitrophota bacterium]